MKTTPLIWRSIAIALAASSGMAASSPEAARPMEIPVFSPPDHLLKGAEANTASAFLLPRQVEYLPGARLRLRMTGSPLLKSAGSLVTIELNNRVITSFPWENPAPGETRDILLPIGEESLQTGWNKILAKATLASRLEEPPGTDNPAAWLQFENGTGLDIPWARESEFPELARFPSTLVEEHLLQKGAPGGHSLSILLPENPDESDLRALLIACARLGQSSWLQADDIRIGTLAEWLKNSGFGLLIGRIGDLKNLDLPAEIRTALDGLQEGEGFLADLAGEENCSRWIVASGANPSGMDVAAQVLGSTRMIKNAPSNHWTIPHAPGFAAADDVLATGEADQAGRQDGWGDLAGLRAIGARDSHLQKTVVLVPSENVPARQEILKILGLEWGRRWRDSPHLCPEVATYGQKNPPSAERLKGRSGYVFGSAAQWGDAIENRGLLAIDADHEGKLRLHNERMVGSEEDVDWCFVQWVPSPWSHGEAFAVMGGVRDFGGDALVRTLTEPETIDRIAGSAAAVDSEGRVVCYDTRTAQPLSFAEKLSREGSQDPGAIATEHERTTEAGIQAGVVDAWLGVAGALLLGVLFGWQRWTVRRRKQREVLK